MTANPRLNRLFGPDQKCLDVALDHGIFNEPRFLKGIEDISQVIQALVEGGPDAIQLAPGVAHHLQSIRGRDKPALVLRTDTTNAYGQIAPQHPFCQLIENSVEIAVRLDAACVIVNLLFIESQPDLYQEGIANVGRLKPLCEAYNMPLMVEPLAMKTDIQTGGYVADGRIDKITSVVRMAVELGADVIKADPADDLSQYHKIVEAAAPVPVLVRGGGRVSDEEILSRTVELMEQNIAGIVYGRNIIQHPQPAIMTRALMAVVHKQASVPEAMQFLIS
jgi:class I fructose-bisphosphate aldolase